MGHKSTEDWDLFSLAAASLCSEGKLQKDIAQELKVSQPEVSRLLKRAVENGWLQTTPRLACTDQALLERMRTRFFSASKLLQKLKGLEPKSAGILRKISVFHSDKGRFGPAAARPIEELVQKAAIVGVTWGRTLSDLVAGLREHFTHPVRKDDPIQFVPLCGEPLKDRQDPVKCSSSALAAELDELVNGNKPSTSPSLAGVPAFIPVCFDNPEEVQTIRKFICQVAGYGSVFGEGGNADGRGGRQARLVHRVDTVLTSLGTVDPVLRGIFLAERVEFGEITEPELVKSVSGDIGGIIIPRRDVTPEQETRINDMNDRWTGIKLDHLRSCARSAMRGKRPGVIVLAIGRAKAEMVRRCVELGLVNELVLDRELADALEGASVQASRTGGT